MKKDADPLNRDIGMRIRRMRTYFSVTQEGMAKLMGLTGSAYAKIERGETNVSVTQLYKIAEIFGVEVTSFFTDDKKPQTYKNDLAAIRRELTLLRKLIK